MDSKLSLIVAYSASGDRALKMEKMTTARLRHALALLRRSVELNNAPAPTKS